MIVLDGEKMNASRAAKKIVWFYGAQCIGNDLKNLGVAESELVEEERIELVAQLKKQETRVRGLFGF